MPWSGKVYTLMREIELKPSRWLGALLAVVVVLAVVALGLAAMPVSAKLAGTMVVFGVAASAARGALRKETLRLRPDGRLQGRDAAGEWRDVEVLGDSFVSPALVVLRYRLENAPTRSLALLSDSGTADDLRRLRASLRWARHTRSGTSSPGAG